MTYELTNEEKIEIINQHLKNLEYSLFNATISLIEEEAISKPDAETVKNLTDQISGLNAKKSALVSEIDSLS